MNFRKLDADLRASMTREREPMSHTFEGPCGTAFTFNSDLSGNVTAFVPVACPVGAQWVQCGSEDKDGRLVIQIPGQDIYAFCVEMMKREMESRMEDLERA